MDWETIRGSWKQYQGQIRSKWGKLTDQDMERVKGKRDELVGVIRERYGMAKDKAEVEVDKWLAQIKPSKGNQPHP